MTSTPQEGMRVWWRLQGGEILQNGLLLWHFSYLPCAHCDSVSVSLSDSAVVQTLLHVTVILQGDKSLLHCDKSLHFEIFVTSPLQCDRSIYICVTSPYKMCQAHIHRSTCTCVKFLYSLNRLWQVSIHFDKSPTYYICVKFLYRVNRHFQNLLQSKVVYSTISKWLLLQPMV